MERENEALRVRAEEARRSAEDARADVAATLGKHCDSPAMRARVPRRGR